MAESAAHLVDSILPHVPVRQWVLSVPHSLRYLLAYDAEASTAVLGVFVHEVFRWLRHTAKRELDLRSVDEAHPGAVTVIHRAGGAVNLNLHYHSLVLDGVYVVEGASLSSTRCLRQTSTTWPMWLGARAWGHSELWGPSAKTGRRRRTRRTSSRSPIHCSSTVLRRRCAT